MAFLSLGIGTYSFASDYGDGVLISGGTPLRPTTSRRSLNSTQSKALSKDVEELINEYIQQFVINSVMKKVNDIMQKAVAAQNIQIFPQIANMAVQQASIDIFKQGAMKDIISKAYEKSRDHAIAKQKQGTAQSVIKSDIKTIVDDNLAAIDSEEVFRRIVEHYLNQAAKEHQKFTMQTVANRQAQLVALQRQEAAVKFALQQQYLKAVEQSMQQQYMQQEYLKQMR